MWGDVKDRDSKKKKRGGTLVNEGKASLSQRGNRER